MTPLRPRRPAAQCGPLRRLIAALIGRAWRRLCEERRLRADRRALERLPDHILKDIGMGRSEIPYASRCADFERQREALRQAADRPGPTSAAAHSPPARRDDAA